MIYAPLLTRRRVHFKPRPPRQPYSQVEALHHFAEFGRLNAQLIHEISSPLTAALLELEQSKRRSARARQAHQSLQTIQRYIEAARQQVRGEVRRLPFNIREQVLQVKRTTLPLARAARVQLRFEPAPPGLWYGDAIKFQQILVNLIANAIDAYRHDAATSLQKIVVIRVRRDNRRLHIRITDWGEGIAARQLSRIFDPFYTTKTDVTVPGLGLGLATVRQYVTQDFHGTLTVTSSRRHGTEFCLKLPYIPS